MKIAAIIFTLCAAVVTAAPAPEGLEVVSRADCSWCTNMYAFCVKNGHTSGQEGCMKTCREHVCHRYAECKSCGGDVFSLCPEVSRFPHYN